MACASSGDCAADRFSAVDRLPSMWPLVQHDSAGDAMSGLRRARAAVRANNAAITEAKRHARQLAADQRAALFLALLKRDGLPAPEREVQFHDTRQWRFDYCWRSARVALEVEGGAFSGGRHTRGAGFREDLAKYNEATRLGWRVLRVLPEQLDTLATIALVRATLTPQEHA